MSFWGELGRRNVFKVGAAYAIVAWLLIQAASIFLPTFEAPGWVMRAFSFVLIAGFPIALVIAWAFELTPQGLKKTADVDLNDSITQSTGQKLNYIVTGLLVLAVAFMAVDTYLLDDTEAGSGETQASVAPDESAGPSTAAVETTDSGVLPNSIAVIPFLNLSPNEDDAYFAVGIHEEILNQLFKLSNLNVIARTSVMRYANTDKSIPEIARELNVGAVMEGSVRYADGQVLVTTQLIDATTNVHLWSESYQRDFSNIFGIQSDIAMNVANALRAEFSAGEQRSIEESPTSSIEAYDHYLLAQSLTRQGAPALTQAIDEYERALSLDPDFRLAILGLARTYAIRATLSNDPQARGLAQQAEDRAIEIAQEMPAALELIANRRIRELDWIGAERAYVDWLERAPANNYEANLAYGAFLKNVGRSRESVPYLELARRADPLLAGPLIQLTMAYDSFGDTDRAVALYERMDDLVGTDFTAMAPQFWRVLERDGVDAALGVIAESNNTPEVNTREWLRSLPNARDASRVFRIFGQYLDDAENGLPALRDVYEDPTSDNFVVMLNIALLAAYYDDAGLSAAALRRYSMDLPLILLQFAWTSEMEPVRSHDEFKEMVRELGLPSYWREAGWPEHCAPVGVDDFECS
jgi:TolB-like protein